MSLFKNKVMIAIMATAMIAMSSSVYAKAAGEDKVTEAAENTIAKVEEAISLVEKGADKEAVAKAINEARQIQKLWRFEVTERQRERENNKLKIARDAFLKGEAQPAEATLREALAGFKEMKAKYDLTH
jgi:type II secretory pathway component PulJ